MIRPITLSSHRDPSWPHEANVRGL
jgi:hypothetical protein